MKQIDPKPFRYTLRARDLRKESTQAENLLWSCLRNRKILGLKFRRQHTIDRYIVDFVCVRKKIVIEIDGSVHSDSRQAKHDREKYECLRKLGYTVLRFWNFEVESSPSHVTKRILNTCLVNCTGYCHCSRKRQ